MGAETCSQFVGWRGQRDSLLTVVVEEKAAKAIEYSEGRERVGNLEARLPSQRKSGQGRQWTEVVGELNVEVVELQICDWKSSSRSAMTLLGGSQPLTRGGAGIDLLRYSCQWAEQQ